MIHLGTWADAIPDSAVWLVLGTPILFCILTIWYLFHSVKRSDRKDD